MGANPLPMFDLIGQCEHLMSRLVWLLAISLSLAACTGTATLPAPTVTLPVHTPTVPTLTPTRPAPTETLAPTVTSSSAPDLVEATATLTPSRAAPTFTPAPTPTYDPESWQTLPVIPAAGSLKMREVYQRGLEQGNNPRAFSKIGDCETQTEYFLIDFDLGSRAYNLGPYADLKGVIDQFAGSFRRTSLAAKRGFTAASVLAVFESDLKQCQGNESPLACELRINKSSMVLIMLGTNDVITRRKTFETYLRQIIEYNLAHGVVPILATKADNLEGDGSINKIIAGLAHEYDLPLWNFWLAVQPLPAHGLQADGTHLTFGKNHFDDPQDMQYAWPVRNLTALQVLDAVWKSVSSP
jgi:hypothetical protein